MKLKTRFSLCTSATITVDDDDGDKTFSTGETTPATFSSLTSPASSLSSLQSHSSLQTLPSVPSLQTLILFETATVTLTHSLSATLTLPSSVTSLSLSSSLLYAASGHQITVYDSSSLTPLETFSTTSTSTGSVKSIAFYKSKCLTAHQDGKIRVWKTPNQQQDNQQIKHIHKLVATLPTVKDRAINYPFPKSHVQVRRHKTKLWVEHNDAVSCIAVSGKSIYTTSWDKTLKVWGQRNLRCKESVSAHDDAINALAVSADGVVYTGSAEGRIRVWWAQESDKKKRNHVLIATLERHKSAVNALALNEDGTMLYSGACDRSILVWEREDGGKYMAVSGALRGHGGAILCLINVCDLLVSGSADRTVRIWRREFDGKFSCLAVLKGHKKAVKCLAAKLEGDNVISLFSGGLDGEIKLWSINIHSSNQDFKSK